MNALEWILISLWGLLALAVLAFAGVYFTRFLTMGSIRKLSGSAEGYGLYRMDVKFAYDLDRLTRSGFRNNDQVAGTILKAALPLLPIHMKSPQYGCSSFSFRDREGNVLLGRNYDFNFDTSAMLMFCAPKKGYRSVSTAALDHVSVKEIRSLRDRLAALATPFICLDGMNEKGVGISVLWVDSPPTVQNTGKPGLCTTLAIRLVLDRAATTEEAVDLLRRYDMFAVSGGDYQFYITDDAGDGRVVEYDCHSPGRELTALPVRSATNFYQLYIDKVLPRQNNGIYGHGRERYDLLEELFTESGENLTGELAWQALEAAQQLPKEGKKTSNTQWSIVYNVTKHTAGIVLRRNWEEITEYSL